MKKPKNRRERDKLRALKPELNLKIRSEEIGDYDYLDKLSFSEKKWLNDFTDEWVNAAVSDKNKPRFHTKKEDKKKCYDRNNARNRDIMSHARARNMLFSASEVSTKEENGRSIDEEDKLLSKLDDDLNDTQDDT
jgi:hypothetical protein